MKIAFYVPAWLKYIKLPRELNRIGNAKRSLKKHDGKLSKNIISKCTRNT